MSSTPTLRLSDLTPAWQPVAERVSTMNGDHWIWSLEPDEARELQHGRDVLGTFTTAQTRRDGRFVLLARVVAR